jgi:hypothetical protein
VAELSLPHGVACILFLAIGLLGTCWTRAVQSYELKLFEFNPLLLTSYLREYVLSETYVWQVRIVGGMCLLAAGACFHALLVR